MRSFTGHFSPPQEDGIFFLTPALYRWEREKRSQHFVETTLPFIREDEDGFGPVTCEFYEAGQQLFLLPAGEGQDEGERRV